MGPMGIDDYMSLLPGSDRQLELREIVDVMNGDGLDYEIDLELKTEEVPPTSFPRIRRVWGGRLGWVGRRRWTRTSAF